MSNYHRKRSTTQLFPFVDEVLSVLRGKKKIHWNKKGLRQKGLMEEMFLEF